MDGESCPRDSWRKYETGLRENVLPVACGSAGGGDQGCHGMTQRKGRVPDTVPSCLLNASSSLDMKLILYMIGNDSAII